VYGEAQELMKFFWFFLFTKRTTWLGFAALLPRFAAEGQPNLLAAVA